MRIGITGYAKSGKDVVADVLVEEFGFVKVNMSDALDHYLQVLNPIIEWPAFGQPFRYAEVRETLSLTEAKEIPEVRELLQRLGTEVGRDIDPHMWVKQLNKRAAQHENVVTTGIRFPEEADPLDMLIWVHREGYGPINTHISDTGMTTLFAAADVCINNNGTLDDLRAKTRRAIP